MTDQTTAFGGRQPQHRSDDPDRELMARLAAGDVDALDLLIARHWDGVAGFAARSTGDADEADDLAQEAFMALWVGRRGWTADTRPLSLLLRVVRNRIINEGRSRDVRRRSESKIRHIESARRGPDPSQSLEGREVERAFRQALDALSPRRREVFELARFQGLSYAEIAEVLGTSTQTVANQMSAALSELRSALQPFRNERTETAF
jgi:RNA polymerase sigma-70 factor, ECF subfamily